jgi:diaminopimelate epimerase
MNHKPIIFAKMHGLGNDFVIINTLHESLDLKTLPLSQMADRHLGVGFDQLLIIEPPRRGDYFCRIFNADGSEAEQCGNGLRCVARYLHEKGLHPRTSMVLETMAGLFSVFIKDYEHIRVTMGQPSICEKLTKFPLTSLASVSLSIIFTGNPHAIVKVDKVDEIDIAMVGREISSPAYFPEGANIGVMQLLDRSHVRLRTFERGIGETHACGSNACAAAVAGIINDWLTSPVTIEYRYGNLMVEWEGSNDSIYLTGAATHVFSGEWMPA